MKRVYNFSAGPSMLPVSVLEKAAGEMLCYGDSGMSVMEMSHRSAVYDEIIKSAEALLREIMEIPDNYKVLFLQGGAATQFAAVPLNLMNKNKKADYILSGQFSTKAYKEAQKYGDVVLLHHQRMTTSHAFPRQQESHSDLMLTMFTSALTTQYTEQSSHIFQTQAIFRLLQICHPALSVSLLTFPSSV